MKLFLLTSFGFAGYGGDGEHREGLDREPRQVCPIPRGERLAPIEGARLGRYPHIGGGGISALQLQVGRDLRFAVTRFKPGYRGVFLKIISWAIFF